MFDKIGKLLLKTNVLSALSIACIAAMLVVLYSIAGLAETGIFPVIGFFSMMFVGIVLLLHAVYFYRIRNKSIGDTKLIKKMISAVNVIGIFALMASFMFLTVAAAAVMFLVFLWILVIVGLNLASTIEKTEEL